MCLKIVNCLTFTVINLKYIYLAKSLRLDINPIIYQNYFEIVNLKFQSYLKTYCLFIKNYLCFIIIITF